MLRVLFLSDLRNRYCREHFRRVAVRWIKCLQPMRPCQSGQRGVGGPPSLVSYRHGGGDAAVDVEDGAGDVAGFI